MKRRSLICAAMALTLLGSSAVMAQEEDRDQNRHFEHHQPPAAPAPHHWARGERLPDQYRDKHYEVTDWHARHLHKPPRGYHYVRTDEGSIVLAAVTTGVIANVLLNQH